MGLLRKIKEFFRVDQDFSADPPVSQAGPRHAEPSPWTLGQPASEPSPSPGTGSFRYPAPRKDDAQRTSDLNDPDQPSPGRIGGSN